MAKFDSYERYKQRKETQALSQNCNTHDDDLQRRC
jgi:hypothetical protein